MDKVRQILAEIKKYHFWVLTVVAIVVGLFGWFRASNNLQQEYETNRGKLQSYSQQLQGIVGKEAHPNEQINSAILEQTKQQSELVRQLWTQLYEHQKQEVLSWPEELPPRFRGTVERLRFGEEIDLGLRPLYQNYVETEFSQLPEIVETSSESLRLSDGRGASPRPTATVRRGGPEEENAQPESFLVYWDDYATIAEDLQSVSASVPSALMVWLTQENLWVYKTLLNVIAETNDGATGHHDAIVKRIEQLQVGREAALADGTRGRIFVPETAQGTMPSEPPPSEMGPGGREGEIQDLGKQWIDSRYLDENGEPIPGDPIAGNQLGVLKRLPIRMRLEMDQRELPRLIAHCANAALPVEVTQVRINVAESDSGRSSARGTVSRRRESGPVRRTAGSRGGGPAPDPAIVPVVIHGIVYIFNPPDDQALGISPEGQPLAKLE